MCGYTLVLRGHYKCIIKKGFNASLGTWFCGKYTQTLCEVIVSHHRATLRLNTICSNTYRAQDNWRGTLYTSIAHINKYINLDHLLRCHEATQRAGTAGQLEIPKSCASRYHCRRVTFICTLTTPRLHSMNRAANLLNDIDINFNKFISIQILHQFSYTRTFDLETNISKRKRSIVCVSVGKLSFRK